MVGPQTQVCSIFRVKLWKNESGGQITWSRFELTEPKGWGITLLQIVSNYLPVDTT
jgi:hypothetical protein